MVMFTCGRCKKEISPGQELARGPNNTIVHAACYKQGKAHGQVLTAQEVEALTLYGQDYNATKPSGHDVTKYEGGERPNPEGEGPSPDVGRVHPATPEGPR